jgi:hypothetical protein
VDSLSKAVCEISNAVRSQLGISGYGGTSSIPLTTPFDLDGFLSAMVPTMGRTIKLVGSHLKVCERWACVISALK